MARSLGKRQRLVLMQLGGLLLHQSEPGVKSMCIRGFLERESNGWCRITAAGLRRLADEIDAGRIKWRDHG